MRTSAGASFYYTTDALGSTILLTDSAQAKAATYTYDSWGNTTSTGTQAATNPWQYASGYKDTATGNTKFGARYYNPATARFTQPDPSGQETNTYLYASASPINNTDPNGLDDAAQGYGTVGGTVCFILCGHASINWGPGGVYFGYGGGIGLRAEASFSAGGGYGVLAPTGNVTVECSGFLPGGATDGVNLTPLGGYLTFGGGIGGGCSLNASNYRKLL